jgi:outer membrane receptor protein involved in Fe transport
MFRALDSLPGADVPEGSSRVGLRGGRDDQVLILLDGLELLAPYHLQEFDSALSIVAPSVLDRAELMTSGYPAEYGDRLGGVVDLTTATPNGRTFTLGLGLLYGEAGAAGLFDDGRGSWYGAGRSGTYRLALELDGRRANPRFWDLFAKVGHSPARGHSLRLESLVAEDEYGLGPESRDEDYDSRWLNRYAWLAHDGVLGPRLFVETLVSGGEVTRNRAGESSAGTDRFEVRDHRTLEIAGIKQRWQVEPIPDQVLVMGFEARRLRSSVEYANERLLTGPLAPLRDSPAVGTTAFRDRYDFDQRGAFATVRTTAFESLSGELGLRYDDDSLTRESHFSPRLNLAWSATPDSVVRLAWGWFHQSQRPNEVQVEDGEVSLAPAERSEHRVLGLEHRFAGGSALWMEAFERRLTRARPRWENLFDPLVVFPELGEDRVRIDPAGGTTEGVEVAWRSPRREPVRWQAAYTFSSAQEDLDGVTVRQSLDQPHALRAGVDLRIAGEWFADAVWHYHTGWPTTRVSGTAGTGEAAGVTPELGPLRGERLPAYHRLDLRLRRSWPLAGGRLSAYLDLQNVYDRENVRGFRDFDLGPDPAGGIAVRSRELTWGGFLPSFGVRWEM